MLTRLAGLIFCLVSFKIGLSQDYSQRGGTSLRNNVASSATTPTSWCVDDGRKNIKWSAQLGSETYGSPVVSDGRVFVGTNNAAGHVKRYPPNIDLGRSPVCLHV